MAELLWRAGRDLARLRCTRGRSRRTQLRIIRTSTNLLAAAMLFAGAAVNAEAECEPRFVNTIGIPDIGDRARPFFADIDGDGDLDAFVGDEIDYMMWSFENVGTPGAPLFAPAERDPFAQGDVSYLSFVFAPALTDIDGDGDLDAFVGESAGDTYFLANTGTKVSPEFASVVVNPFGLLNVDDNAAPSFVDIDSDKDYDAFIGNAEGDIIFFENVGTRKLPRFADPQPNPFGLTSVTGAAAPSFGDLDADGDLDLLVGDQAGNLTFLENTGTAIAPAFGGPLANVFGLQNLTNPLGDLGEEASPHLVDIDGDGDLDAFVGGYRGNVFLFENTGTSGAPQFRPPMLSPLGLTGEYMAATTFVDIDTDGDQDAFVCDGNDHRFFRNTGSSSAPGFTMQAVNPFGLLPPTSVGKLSFADIDADADSDAFFATQVFLNTGTPTVASFAPPAVNPFGMTLGTASPSLGDIDGDGDLDAFVGSHPTIFLQNTGTAALPAFAAPVPNPFGFSNPGLSGIESPELADIDGDGDLDAVLSVYDEIGEYSRFVTVFLENEGSTTNPSFAAPQVRGFNFSDDDHSSSFAFVDIDNDGDQDAFLGASGYTVGHRDDVPSSIVFARNDSLCGIHCPSEPKASCALPEKASLQIGLGEDPSGDELLWKWTRGTSSKGEFGNPSVGTPLAFCVYEEQELAMSAILPPAETCDGADCWKEVTKGFRYTDKNASAAGIAKVKLRAGTGKAKLMVRGEGMALSPPTLPFDPTSSVTVQLINPRTDDACWESTFAAPARRSDAAGFKDKLP